MGWVLIVLIQGRFADLPHLRTESRYLFQLKILFFTVILKVIRTVCNQAEHLHSRRLPT